MTPSNASPEARPLRIGFLTTYYPGEPSSDGIGAYIHALAKMWAAQGHSVFVLLTRRPLGWQSKADGVCLIGTGLSSRVLDTRSAWKLPIFSWRVARLARKLRLDILETYEYGGEAALVQRFNRSAVPVIVRLHVAAAIVQRTNAADRGSTPGLFAKARFWLERTTIAQADAVTAIANQVVQRTNEVLDTRLENVPIIPNPVDLAFFEHCPEPPPDSLVTMVGRLEWRKGPDVLARAAVRIAPQHSNVRFVIVGGEMGGAPGGGSIGEFVTALMPPELQGRFTFAGDVPHDHVIDSLRRSTVCVFPSRWEGFGIAAAEAAALGKPIVITSTTGLAEWLHHDESALIVPPDDVEALATAISRLLADAELRSRLGRAARAVAEEHFRPEKVADALVAFYRRVLARQRKR